jgi:hypothetical protein
MNEALARLLGRSTRTDSGRAGEIADLVRATLGVTDQEAVTVQQLACTEPGCPPIETKIVILSSSASRRWTIPAPMSEVDDVMVRTALATAPEGENA